MASISGWIERNNIGFYIKIFSELLDIMKNDVMMSETGDPSTCQFVIVKTSEMEIPKSFIVLEQLAGPAWPHFRKIFINFINIHREIKPLKSYKFLLDILYHHYQDLLKSHQKPYESYLLNVLHVLNSSPDKDKDFLCFLSGGPCEGPSGNPKYPQFK